MKTVQWWTGAALVLAACSGDDGNGAGGAPLSHADGGSPDIAYPDSHCDAEACVEGACDPTGRDDGRPACNAWMVEATFALHAVALAPDGSLGVPPEPDGADEDVCPGRTTVPDWVEGEHCCQRTDPTGEPQPAYKTVSMTMTRPALFALGAVSQNNRSALDEDRFNPIMVLSSREDGPVTLTSGLGLLNTDGSFQLARGPFEIGGRSWNQDGAWDPHAIPGTLSTQPDGTHLLTMEQYVPERPYGSPSWGNDAREYVGLVLRQTGIRQRITFSEDFSCAGVREPGHYAHHGELTSFVRVEDARDSELKLSEDGPGFNLCELLAGVKSCEGEPASWQPHR